ncbi:hypothetical protein F5B18DRAFT_602268 [Nemania serpens]|nr:hypothetical protein F5B18DRAFT_602268 [Nemania serpens]
MPIASCSSYLCNRNCDLIMQTNENWNELSHGFRRGEQHHTVTVQRRAVTVFHGNGSYARDTYLGESQVKLVCGHSRVELLLGMTCQAAALPAFVYVVCVNIFLAAAAGQSRVDTDRYAPAIYPRDCFLSAHSFASLKPDALTPCPLRHLPSSRKHPLASVTICNEPSNIICLSNNITTVPADVGVAALTSMVCGLLGTRHLPTLQRRECAYDNFWA